MVEWATIHAASTALVIGPMVLAALCTALRTLIVFGWWPPNDRLNSPRLAQAFDHAAIMGLIIGLISIPVVVLTGTLSSPHGGMGSATTVSKTLLSGVLIGAALGGQHGRIEIVFQNCHRGVHGQEPHRAGRAEPHRAGSGGPGDYVWAVHAEFPRGGAGIVVGKGGGAGGR